MWYSVSPDAFGDLESLDGFGDIYSMCEVDVVASVAPDAYPYTEFDI